MAVHACPAFFRCRTSAVLTAYPCRHIPSCLATSTITLSRYAVPPSALFPCLPTMASRFPFVCRCRAEIKRDSVAWRGRKSRARLAHALFGRMGGPDGPSRHACRIVVGTFGAQEALPGLSCKMGAHIVRLATSSAKEAAPPRCEWPRAWIRAERRLYAAPLPHAATHTALQPWRAWHQPPPGLAFAGHRLDVCT